MGSNKYKMPLIECTYGCTYVCLSMRMTMYVLLVANKNMFGIEFEKI